MRGWVSVERHGEACPDAAATAWFGRVRPGRAGLGEARPGVAVGAPLGLARLGADGMAVEAGLGEAGLDGAGRGRA